LAKVGTGTVKNSYGSTTLIVTTYLELENSIFESKEMLSSLRRLSSVIVGFSSEGAMPKDSLKINEDDLLPTLLSCRWQRSQTAAL
jgi:hypothetical protein